MAAPDANSSTAEVKLANLEKRFASLEKTYKDLHEKIYTLTDKSTGKSTEVALTQLLPSTNDAKDTNTVSIIPNKATFKKTKVIDKVAEELAVPKSRAKILISKVDPNTGERKDQLQSDKPATSTASTDPLDTPAFTLRKFVYDREDDNDGELEILSPGLLDLLKTVILDDPSQKLPKIHYTPYKSLVYNWDKLVNAMNEEPKGETDKQAREDLKVLLNTILGGSGDVKLDRYFKTRATNKDQSAVTFESLWTIFPPGTLVYGKPFQGQDQVFLVGSFQDVPLATSPTLKGYSWSLQSWMYDWDGKKFKRSSVNLKFDTFNGTRLTTELPFYPLEHHSDFEGIKIKLIERGKIFKNVCKVKEGSRMFEYRGSAVLDKKGFSGFHSDDSKDNDEMSSSTFDSESYLRRLGLLPPSERSQSAPAKTSDIESRVMVDYESYFRYGPSCVRVGSLSAQSEQDECLCEDCQKKKALRAKFDDEEYQKGEWDNEQYILCPPRVLGYILRDKQWAQLQVDNLSLIPENDDKNSWSTRLQLADENKTKEMILGLVKGHGSNNSAEENRLEVDDIVAKKGKGLVILLYGPPGVGKTSTAETVAIAAQKPLFSISVADVGTKATNVESNLAKIFALATSWQAILLIDEADVFLESRGKGIGNNTERNALVSVFLRVLEYYQGILMLTTNQIAKFDIAVQSRIHIAIKYSNLNPKQTMAIFKGFLDPLNDKNLIHDMTDIEEWLSEDVCKMGFDGRQIRNIITSALGLARHKNESKLSKKDIKQVLGNVKEFKEEFVRQFEKYKNEQDGMVG